MEQATAQPGVFANFFASVMTYLSGIAIFQMVLSVFMQIVLVLVTGFGIGVITAQVMMFIAFALVALGICTFASYAFKGFLKVYAYVSEKTSGLASRFTKKAA